MSLPQSQGYFSVGEYLTLERESEERHEYLDGYVYAMAGESPEHRDICSNLVSILHLQLRGTHCRVWTKDTKVRSGPEPRSRRATKGFFRVPIWLLSVAHHNFTMRTAMYSSIQPSSLKFYRLPLKPLIVERNSGVTARGYLH